MCPSWNGPNLPPQPYTFNASLSNPSQCLVDSFSNGDRFLPYTLQYCDFYPNLLEHFNSLWFCTICSFFLNSFPSTPHLGIQSHGSQQSSYITLTVKLSFHNFNEFDICKVNHSFLYTNFITCPPYFQTYFIVIMHLKNVSPTWLWSH